MSPPQTPIKTVLAIDYGARRTGLAVGQTLTRQATALKTLHHPWNKPDWAALDKIFERWQPGLVVIGYPGSPCTKPQRKPDTGFYIKNFQKQLRKRYAIESRLIDESYTSAVARDELRYQRRNLALARPIRRADTDAVAATVILNSWFGADQSGAATGAEP